MATSFEAAELANIIHVVRYIRSTRKRAELRSTSRQCQSLDVTDVVPQDKIKDCRELNYNEEENTSLIIPDTSNQREEVDNHQHQQKHFNEEITSVISPQIGYQKDKVDDCQNNDYNEEESTSRNHLGFEDNAQLKEETNDHRQMDCNEKENSVATPSDTSILKETDERKQMDYTEVGVENTSASLPETNNIEVEVDYSHQMDCNEQEYTCYKKEVDECQQKDDAEKTTSTIPPGTSYQKGDDCQQMQYNDKEGTPAIPPEKINQKENGKDQQPRGYFEEEHASPFTDYTFHLPTNPLMLLFEPEEWDSIKPQERLPGKPRHLSGDWTDRISDKLREHYPCCVLNFKYNRVKAANSRKVNAPYFKGKAICKGPSCSAKFNMQINQEPFPGDPVYVQCFVDGNVIHFNDDIIKRQVKGTRRQQIAAAASKLGAVNYYYNALGSTPTEELEGGNITNCQTTSVLRKMISETVTKEHLHSNVITELELLKEAFQSEDIGNTTDTTGYIKDISTDPFCVTLMCPEQVQLARSLSQKRQLNMYIDATGSVISSIPKQRRPYLYSVVVKPHEDVPPVSIADMLSTQHTMPRIEYFLSSMKREIELGGRQLHVQKVETDFSWALIQSSLKTFNLMNIKQYLLTAFNVVYGKKEKAFIDDFTVIHLCAGHMMHDICRKLKSIGGLTAKKRLRKFVLQCFARLQNCIVMSEAILLFKLMCTVLGRPYSSDDVSEALTTLRKSMLGCEEEVENESVQEEKQEMIEQDEEILTFEGKTIKEMSPFTSVFLEVFQDSNTSCDKDDPSNTLYCPEFLRLMCEKLFPIFPLWSGILLEPSRYADKTKQVTKSRDSNAPVESWFKVLKRDSGIKKHERPARFVIALRRTLKGRLRESKFPTIRKKKQKKDSGISLNQKIEKWGKKDNRKPAYHTMPKQKVSPQCLPAVPAWGGQVEGANMVNTCTIDNGLTTIFMAYKEDSQFKKYLKDGIFAVVAGCCRLMMKEKFAEAKAMWLESTGVPLERTTNIHGDEYDLFVSFINDSLNTKLVSRCSDRSCPEPYHEHKDVRGINVSSSLKKPDSVIVDSLLENWDHFTTECKADLFDLPGDGDPKATKSVLSQCPGQRSHKRVLVSHIPPIVCLRVYDLVQCANFPTDVRKYSDNLTLIERQYKLVGATLYRPGHYTSVIKSKEHGWLFYDGLKGQLQHHAPSLTSSYRPSHLIYVLT